VHAPPRHKAAAPKVSKTNVASGPSKLFEILCGNFLEKLTAPSFWKNCRRATRISLRGRAI
jgi:hypothetical protein